MSTVFQFRAVSVVRADTRVLDDLTVTLPDRGITAVIGVSGAGKSTLLRCCNLLESPSRGQVLFRGADLAALDPRAHRRRVAMVFQTPTVFAGTCRDNLRAADAHLDPAAATGLLMRVGLPAELLDREADTLSGGEAQRLCLARALATGPEVILADECTSSLDQGATTLLERLARTLARDGTPVVWVTHDLAQLRRIADRVVELDQGRLVFAGPLSEYIREATEVE